MADYKQTTRSGEVKIPTLEGSKLVLQKFSGRESISEPFEFRVIIVSENAADVDFDPALGQNVTVTYHTPDQQDRFFVGTLAEAQGIDKTDVGYVYELTLRSSLWVLSNRVNSRVFHDKTVKEILDVIFGEYGGLIEKQDKANSKSYPKIEHCVQYRESDFAFVSRLLEAHGIFYYYSFEDNKQTLVLGDGKDAYSGEGKRPFIPGGPSTNVGVDIKEHFWDWSSERRFTGGKVTLRDYKFENPTDKMKAEKEGDAKFDPGKLETYDFPYSQFLGKEIGTGPGDVFAQRRLDSIRTFDNRVAAAGDCSSLYAGAKITLDKHPNEKGDFVVLRAQHSFAVEDYRAGSPGAGGEPYRGAYELLKADLNYAPPLQTPKPFVAGVQTGVVVGKSDGLDRENEIDTDEHARVRVHMHWNREEPNKDDGQTMWTRVGQLWAGSKKGYGAIFIPRIGMEVLISHVDGDPDHPVIIGCVYNADNPPPYPLPDEAHTAGWKSRSLKHDGYNELVLIDDDKSELIRMHAEKDLDSTIEESEKRNVRSNRDTKVGMEPRTGGPGNDTLDVGAELKITAGTKIVLTCGQSTITMDPGSITIESVKIDVKAQAMLTTKGGMADHGADSMMKIHAAMIMIN